MPPDITEQRQQAHALLDLLPGEKVSVVRSLLEVMVEPSYTVASAPVQEEAIRSDTADAIEQARTSLGKGEGISHEEVLREFGLTK